MDNQFLYIVASSTPSRMGRFIRSVTGQAFNHVSVSLDPQLLTLYSFARRYYRTPLYGGFVQETPARYCIDGATARIEVFKIPVSHEIHQQIDALLRNMHTHERHYLYNHLSALFFPLGVHIPIKDSYVCVDFCLKILRLAGLELTQTRHCTVDTIRRFLAPYLDYSGQMPQGNADDSAFFSENPLPHPTFTTIHSMLALLPRLGKNENSG